MDESSQTSVMALRARGRYGGDHDNFVKGNEDLALGKARWRFRESPATRQVGQEARREKGKSVKEHESGRGRKRDKPDRILSLGVVGAMAGVNDWVGQD